MSSAQLPVLSESQLEAFSIVAAEGSFTKAAVVAHLSQPALTRRIQGLEETLAVSLFDRNPQGITLTEAGQKLLLYVKNKRALEQDVLADIMGGAMDQNSAADAVSGLIRIAGHSSIVEPVLMPALASFLIKNPGVQVEFVVKTNSELDEMLNYSKSDFILSNRGGRRKDVEELLLGQEEFVCIENTTHTSRSDVYLDSAPSDTTTEKFFEIQSNAPKKYQRSFMHDENGIMRGVQLGFGRAIKPKQTVKLFDDVRIVKKFSPMIRPVYLRYSRKTYYTRLEQAILDVVKKEVPKLLK